MGSARGLACLPEPRSRSCGPSAIDRRDDLRVIYSASSALFIGEDGAVSRPRCAERRWDADIRALAGCVTVGMSPVDWVRRRDCESRAGALDMVNVQRKGATRRFGD